MTRADYPNLALLLGAYFHEDWMLERASCDDVDAVELASFLHEPVRQAGIGAVVVSPDVGRWRR